MSEETRQLIDKCKKAANDKLKHIEMNYDNMLYLTEFDKELCKVAGNYIPVFIVDNPRKKIYTDNAGWTDPSVYTYEEYVSEIWMLLTQPGCTVYKDNGEMMEEEEWNNMAIKKLNELPLTYNYNSEYVKDMINEKTKNMEMTKENIQKIVDFEHEMFKITHNRNAAGDYTIHDENKTINIMDDEPPVPYEGYINTLWMTVAWEMDDEEEAKKIVDAFNKIELTYKEENNTTEHIINKILNDKVIPIWEERGIIGNHKTFEENKEHLNDILLDYSNDWWEDTLKEITTRYMATLPKNMTQKEIINKIVELCETDTDKKECASEWIISKSKYINKYLYVNTVEKEYADIMTVNDILLYAQTDGDDSLLSFKMWGYYESIGQGDNFSKEELTELLNKIEKIY
jgi:hypothetical protein